LNLPASDTCHPGLLQRYRICPEHRDALAVDLRGEQQRFCQQVRAQKSAPPLPLLLLPPPPLLCLCAVPTQTPTHLMLCPALLQCGTFHPVSEFSGDRRSCRDRLRKLAMRRRKASDASGSRPASWHWEEEQDGGQEAEGEEEATGALAALCYQLQRWQVAS
jgi:hypothetical protein